MVWLGVFLALLSGWCYAGSNVLVQLANRNGSRSVVATAAAFWSLIVNLGLYLVLYTMFQHEGDSNPWSGWALLLFALAGVATVAGRFLKFSSVPLLGPTRAGALRVFSPVYSATLAILLLGERPSYSALLGVTVLLVGVILLHPRSSERADAASESKLDESVSTVHQVHRRTKGVSGPPRNALFLGYLLGVGSAIVFGAGDLLRKSGLQVALSPIEGALIGCIAGLVILGAYLIVVRQLAAVIRTDWGQLRYYLGSGLFTGVAILSFFMALQYLPLSIAAPLTCTEPVVNALLGRYVLKEPRPLVGRNYIGLVSLIVGVAVVFQSL